MERSLTLSRLAVNLDQAAARLAQFQTITPFMGMYLIEA
jgi:hypothetical protein